MFQLKINDLEKIGKVEEVATLPPFFAVNLMP